LSVPPAEIPDALRTLAAQFKDARSALRKLGSEVAVARARALADAAQPDGAGIRRVALEAHDYTGDELRALAQASSSIPGLRFIATLSEPPTVFVAAGPDAGWDAGAVLKAALAEVGGRGGGSAKAAQGTVGRVQDLKDVISRLKFA
jgi:alanyl-tRNA synthetase